MCVEQRKSVTTGVDSGWVLCNPSWGKTIARTACVKELDMHSYVTNGLQNVKH